MEEMKKEGMEDHIKRIKSRFFAFRDGLTADVLRRGGSPHEVIFGLQLPQLAAIAREMDSLDKETRQELGMWLWEDRKVRESRLLAPWLLSRETPIEDAILLARDAREGEEAQQLAFRWLRHLPCLPILVEALEGTPAGRSLQRCLLAD